MDSLDLDKVDGLNVRRSLLVVRGVWLNGNELELLERALAAGMREDFGRAVTYRLNCKRSLSNDLRARLQPVRPAAASGRRQRDRQPAGQ